jgi:hypothetical protein
MQQPALSAVFMCFAMFFTPAEAGPTPTSLPAPAGKYGVGRVSYEWTDGGRSEPLSDSQNAYRDLLVYVWYPTNKKVVSTANRTPYFPGVKAIAASSAVDSTAKFWGDAWPRVSQEKIETSIYEGKKTASGKPFPLIVFWPGLGISTTAYTSLIQEIVSDGYVVASIEPTYEVTIAFSNGKVVPFSPRATGRGIPAPPGEDKAGFLKRLHDFDAAHLYKWVADGRFVIDQLMKLNDKHSGAPFAGRIDFKNVGAWGHSFGGRAAVGACQLDPRFGACLNADGLGPEGPIFTGDDFRLPLQPFMWIELFHEPPTDAQLAPFKMTRNDWEKDHQAQVAKNEKQLQSCVGGAYHVTINLPGIDHASFTDKFLLAASGKDDLDHSQRNMKILAEYSLRFFNWTLRSKKDDLAKPKVEGVTVDRFPVDP